MTYFSQIMVKILGVKIDAETRQEALNQARVFLNGGQHKIFTPNPEMLVKAQDDKYFRSVLNSSDLNLCDGFGLWLAVKGTKKKEQGKKVIERIAGIDFMLDICRLAEEQGRGVYLLGSESDEVIKKTAVNLQKRFPKLIIVGFDKGPTIVETARHCEEREANHVAISLPTDPVDEEAKMLVPVARNDDAAIKINKTLPAILFVGFGMGKQEKWIHENLSKMPSVRIAMGVGGSFDYISGKISRAPRLMRRIGLEWLYRVFKQPQRIQRIFNATVKFILLLLWKN